MSLQAAQQVLSRRCCPAFALPYGHVSSLARRSIDDATDGRPTSKPTSDAPQWPVKYNQGILAGIGVSSALGVLLIVGLCVFVLRKIGVRHQRHRLAFPSVLPIHATSEKLEDFTSRDAKPRRVEWLSRWPACPLLCWDLRYHFRAHACAQAQPQEELFSSLGQEERGPQSASIQAQTLRLPEPIHRTAIFDGEEDASEGLQDSLSFDPIPTPLTVEFALPPGVNVPFSSPPEHAILQDESLNIPFPTSCETTCTGPSDNTRLSQDQLPPRPSLASDVIPSLIGGNASKWDTMPIPGPHLRPPSALGTFPWHIRSPRPTIVHRLPQLKEDRGQLTLPVSLDAQQPNDNESNSMPPTDGIARPDAVYSKWQRLTQTTDRSSTVRERRNSAKRSWTWWERGSPLRAYSSEAPLHPIQGQADVEASQDAAKAPASILQPATVGTQTTAQSSRVHFQSEVIRESLSIEAREAPRQEAPKSPYVFWRDEDGDVSIPIELATDGRTRSSSIGSKFVEQFDDSPSTGGIQGLGELVRNSSVRSGIRAPSGTPGGSGQEGVIDEPQAEEWLVAVSRMEHSESSHGHPAVDQAQADIDKEEEMTQEREAGETHPKAK